MFKIRKYLRQFLHALQAALHYLSRLLGSPLFLRRCILVPLMVFMLGCVPLYIALRAYDNDNKVRWEGVYLDWNFRDVGESVNQCLGEPLLRTGLLYRSNGWFSGWSCEKLKYPDRIVTLSYDPEKREKCFCWDDRNATSNTGIVPDYSVRLDSLERISTWRKPEMRKAACSAIRTIFEALREERKTLVHCSAGRDRTGTVAALLSALALEEAGRLDDDALEALECDYRKTASLEPDKYGRMASFIRAIRKRNRLKGTVSGFIQCECGMDPAEVQTVARVLLNQKAQARLSEN